MGPLGASGMMASVKTASTSGSDPPDSSQGPRERGPAPPNPYGLFSTVDGLGTVAAPLLAGFAVTLIALVLQVETDLRWPSLSLTLLGVAAVLLLQTVQLAARARGYAITPAQVRDWFPDLDRQVERRAVVNWELRHHQACWRALVARARWRYNLAIVSLLLGIAAMLVPAEAARLTTARWCAIAVVLAGAAAEIAVLLTGWGGRRRHRWLRRVTVRLFGWVTAPTPPVPPPPFPIRSVYGGSARSVPATGSGETSPRPASGGTAGADSGPSQRPV